ncbi:helix-turn-helix domain-containing protein [Novispirillum sp. DQ9]|uniref:helix-turn-helix domain-containing protein n=1 Tax=Novispirillum sp. DQ9 TaxID=3398612 RepID=UPI003C7E68EC
MSSTALRRRPGQRFSPDGPDPIDIHVGKRVVLRRKLLGLTQHQVAEAIGVTFQQIQKYEQGVNRVSASRLYDLSRVLQVPITFFFQDAADIVRPATGDSPPSSAAGQPPMPVDDMARNESLELTRRYWALRKDQRKAFRTLLLAMTGQPT